MNYSKEISFQFCTNFDVVRNICIQFIEGKERSFEEENKHNLNKVFQLAKRHRVQRILPLPSNGYITYGKEMFVTERLLTEINQD